MKLFFEGRYKFYFMNMELIIFAKTQHFFLTSRLHFKSQFLNSCKYILINCIKCASKKLFYFAESFLQQDCLERKFFMEEISNFPIITHVLKYVSIWSYAWCVMQIYFIMQSIKVVNTCGKFNIVIKCHQIGKISKTTTNLIKILIIVVNA